MKLSSEEGVNWQKKNLIITLEKVKRVSVIFPTKGKRGESNKVKLKKVTTMASGKSIAVLLVGIVVLLVGVVLFSFWVKIYELLPAYELQIAACQTSPDPPACIALLQQQQQGDLTFMANLYLYAGFGCIAGGGISLLLAINRLLKGN